MQSKMSKSLGHYHVGLTSVCSTHSNTKIFIILHCFTRYLFVYYAQLTARIKLTASLSITIVIYRVVCLVY